MTDRYASNQSAPKNRIHEKKIESGSEGGERQLKPIVFVPLLGANENFVMTTITSSSSNINSSSSSSSSSSSRSRMRRLTMRMSSNWTGIKSPVHSVVAPSPPRKYKRRSVQFSDEVELTELGAALKAPYRDDPYSILQLERNCSDTDVVVMFRALAMKYHPDRNIDQDSIDKFVKICGAYRVLSDNRKRNIYDAFGPSSLQLFTLLQRNNIENEPYQDGVLIFLNRIIYPTWWFKEWRNKAIIQDRSIILLRPDDEIIEKVNRCRSIYFRDAVEFSMAWKRDEANGVPSTSAS